MLTRYGLLGVFLAIAPSANALDAGAPPVLTALHEQAQAANLSAQFLARYSYRPVPLDDTLSAKIMDRFIKSLDPDRMIFLQSDIDHFMADRTGIDDAFRLPVQLAASVFVGDRPSRPLCFRSIRQLCH